VSDELENIEDPQVSEDATAVELPILEPEAEDEPEAAATEEVAEEPDAAVAEELEAEAAVEAAQESEAESADVAEAAPEPAPAPESEAEPVPEAPAEAPHSVSWVPFSVYLALWVTLAVATVLVLRTSAVAGGALWAPEYAFSVYGGIVLVALGPILALVVWLVARQKVEAGHRTGLLTSSFLRAAGATFIGVILWLVALNLLDLYRVGFHA